LACDNSGRRLQRLPVTAYGLWITLKSPGIIEEDEELDLQEQAYNQVQLRLAGGTFHAPTSALDDDNLGAFFLAPKG
jgi:hypothetical protein